ncbi:MAG: peptidylprolyl isomerase [Planctomycetota bacterium]
MNAPRLARLLVTVTAVVVPLAACHKDPGQPPPPDMRRPVIKTEEELSAERAARIERGEIVPTTSPAVGRPPSRPAPPPPLTPAPGAIQGDILLVNDAVLTCAEVLYPLRKELATARAEHTASGFIETARRLVRRQAQQEIGTILIYAQARGKLPDEQQKALDAAVEKELERLIEGEFGGSAAKFAAHLKEYGLTRETYRDGLARMLVVRDFTREQLMPQVRVARAELMRYYEDNRARFSQPETRELLLIELPFERFLPAGEVWDRANAAERAQAKLKAVRRARDAAEALETRAFADVAREFSLGLHAADGGSWGPIARPLQPPYDQLSGLIFAHETGWTSEPTETEAGWYIVGCGRIEPAARRPFSEVQGELREELEGRAFARRSMEYVLKLAENATISSLDAFVTAAVEKAEKLTAPPTPP